MIAVTRPNCWNEHQWQEHQHPKPNRSAPNSARYAPIARKGLSTPIASIRLLWMGVATLLGSQINRGCVGKHINLYGRYPTSPTPCHHPPANSDPYEHPETVTFPPETGPKPASTMFKLEPDDVACSFATPFTEYRAPRVSELVDTLLNDRHKYRACH